MSRFLEITGTSDEGLGRLTRLWLKSFMEQFGEVVSLHKPPASGDPTNDVATVRYARESAAEQAVAALRTGAELNGVPIRADFQAPKAAKDRGRPTSGVLDYDAPVTDSRSFLGRRPPERDRRRSRSRERRGRSASSDRQRTRASARKASRSPSSGGRARGGSSSSSSGRRGKGRKGKSKSRSGGRARRKDASSNSDSESAGAKKDGPDVPEAKTPAAAAERKSGRELRVALEEQLAALRAEVQRDEAELEDLRRQIAAYDDKIKSLAAELA